MAKCLRCGAGSEWIQGRVKREASSDIIDLLDEVRSCIKLGIDCEEKNLHDECLLHMNMALVRINKVIDQMS